MADMVMIVHIISCILLILIVLLQVGKGAGMGAAFGGSSQTVFGSAGPKSFLMKLTAAIAGVFMLTSIGLTILSAKKGTKSVFDKEKKVEKVEEKPAEKGAPPVKEPGK